MATKTAWSEMLSDKMESFLEKKNKVGEMSDSQYFKHIAKPGLLSDKKRTKPITLSYAEFKKDTNEN